MQLAIILLCWKNKTQAQERIDAIQAWEEIKPLVIVVENESEAGDTVSENKNFVKITRARNLGFGGGNNIGIRIAKERNAEYILLMNTDAHIEEPDLLKLLTKMQLEKNLFSVGPKILEGLEEPYNSFYGGKDISKNLNTRMCVEELQNVGEAAIETDYTIGAVMLINAHNLMTVGLFDEQYFFSGEVADLCYRAKSKGFKISTLLESTAYHYVDASNELRKSLYLYYNLRNRMLFIRKMNLSKRLKMFWFYTYLRLFSSFIVAGHWKSARAVRLSFQHVVQSKYGNQNRYFL